MGDNVEEYIAVKNNKTTKHLSAFLSYFIILF